MVQTQPSLNRARVLIVEDEPYIALDLAQMVEDAGGIAVGPALTVRQALDYIDANGIAAAIVDVDLPDGDAGPVLSALADEGAFVVVHTGAGLPDALRARYPGVPVVSKPAQRLMLVQILVDGLQQ